MQASNAGGSGAPSDIWSFTTQFAYQQPVASRPSNNATNQLTTLDLFWQGVADATNYELQVSS
ncbi:hypothetical protein RZS08_63335, partial [Arthrospira platensis SPKY1]|nr:hypothetical protein [Arthrospira platensis SPKY1]